MKESQSRTATATFNLPDQMPAERTYCIIGQGRGGTTMTANLVDMLGVPLTRTHAPNPDGTIRIYGSEDKELMKVVTENGEDIEFRRSVQAPMVAGDAELRKTVQGDTINLNEVKLQLEKRNAKPVWAWKIPQCGPNLPLWYKLIRNPFWIYIIRDHLASALTEVRVNVVKDAIEGLKVKKYHEDFLHNFILKANEEKMPILLISYERIRLHKGKFIFELVKFLGTNPSIEEITEATDYIEEEGPLQKGRAAT